ncbi:MAG: NAD(P)H-dependent oxidoreductase subunit E, partial [Longimicrobiales bacterium]|nr:NAD(P)H-dependent oxidoreductase subunit E [Longimicrobiales bacterium]
MGLRTNEEILAHWSREPAPLLPILHAFHDRDGYLSEEVLGDVSRVLRTPLADLFGTVTFYHHFSREPGGRDAPRVCTGPVCVLKGSLGLLGELVASGGHAMPCAGRCDDPVPVLQGAVALAGMDARSLEARPSPLPVPPPQGIEECVFSQLRERSGRGLAGYRATGGYQALERALGGMGSDGVISELEISGLSGRGGAGFPTWRKWKAVMEVPGDPKSIVCNADEGEPGCFKDRTLMDHDPHAVLEGMILAGYVTGAPRGFIYLRYEYPDTAKILEEA